MYGISSLELMANPLMIQWVIDTTQNLSEAYEWLKINVVVNNNINPHKSNNNVNVLEPLSQK